MHTALVKHAAPAIPLDRIDDRRQSPRRPLMLTAWIWRAQAPGRPIAIRLLDHSDGGVGFVSPLPLPSGERFDLALEYAGTRRSGLQVTHCEFYGDDTFRIGASA